MGDYWSLGTSFLKEWYVTHSLKDERMGFAPHIDSWRTVPEKVMELPTLPLSSYDGELKILNQAPPPMAVAILLSVAGITFLTFTLYIIWIIMDKYRPTRDLATVDDTGLSTIVSTKFSIRSNS